MRRDADAHELIRLSAGAALVGVHSRTLRRWIDQGKLNGWRMASNQIRVSRAELLKLATPMASPSLGVAAGADDSAVGR
ncbi:helix-turn-helix domain-containing protein [Nocardia sp. NPDC057663]|uniref:helix-turn-helix domain-containing protein n=1 Tax=Nocardia sp. NPDC057663 TaxID=3346201 RepID=UPI00366F148A